MPVTSARYLRASRPIRDVCLRITRLKLALPITAFGRAAIAIEPVIEEQAHIARQAYTDLGKGGRRAGLSFGDCLSYALAKTTGESLLFKGEDFNRTDIAPAI